MGDAEELTFEQGFFAGRVHQLGGCGVLCEGSGDVGSADASEAVEHGLGLLEFIGAEGGVEGGDNLEIGADPGYDRGEIFGGGDDIADALVDAFDDEGKFELLDEEHDCEGWLHPAEAVGELEVRRVGKIMFKDGEVEPLGAHGILGRDCGGCDPQIEAAGGQQHDAAPACSCIRVNQQDFSDEIHKLGGRFAGEYRLFGSCAPWGRAAFTYGLPRIRGRQTGDRELPEKGKKALARGRAFP